MKTLKNEKGFTLVELVLVIVVLGLLAAFAVPKFINITSNARTASVNGFAGGLRAAVAVVKAQYMVAGTGTSPVTMADGTTVAVGVAGAAAGVPTGAAAGIGAAMNDMSGFTATYGAPSTFQPTNGGSATCQVSYDATNGSVTVTTTGC
ncbi:MAG: prepilin-type N-terminal cleavage/methylation domain-containing protein [Candidatus Manganitrophus sp.]|nr:MAG: prepilin-type N-terminal cleavage/methylation domain-containing protein [Candidatus Manganitrophus sp.]